MKKYNFVKIKRFFIYTYLAFSATSLFLIAFSITYSGLKFYNENDLSPVSLSSLDTTRRTISEYIPKPYVVYSGSMEPTIKTASLIFTIPSNIYNKGDIITFKKPSSKNTITHRIEAMTFENGIDSPTYITSGDANEDIDQGSIGNENIIGKVYFSIPYVGHAVDFAKKPQGFILLVIIPATIIVYEELKLLFSNIKKYFNRKKKKDTFSDQNNIDLPKIKSPTELSRLSIAIPVVGVFLVFLGITASYFYDKEESIDNILGVGVYGEEPTSTPTPLPSPTPGVALTLVINEVMPNTECYQGNTEAQWLELYNGFDYSVNPKNFKITDGVNTIDLVTANNLSIDPGELLLLAHNSAIWKNCWEDNGTQTGNLGGQLDINTGELRLIDTDGTTTIDTVKWGDPPLDPTTDESIARTPNGFDSAFGIDFNVTDFDIYATPNPGLETP